MHDARHRLSSSKSMGQMPLVAYSPLPPSTALPTGLVGRARDRVSISNLINAVDNARITTTPPTSPPPSSRSPSRSRRPIQNNRAPSAAHGSRAALAQTGVDDMATRRRRVQSEKKRLWRKNLSPDQKAKRQELDAQRKREQRMNMTPDQRAEARRKDAARKAAKRRFQKEQLRGAESPNSSAASSSSQAPTPVSGMPTRRTEGHSSLPYGIEGRSFNRSTIEDLLN